MAYPRFQRARAFKFANRTAGNLTLAGTTTTWVAVDTALDLTLEAQTGDVIEYGLGGQSGNSAVNVAMDVATIVSASVVNLFRGSSATSDGFLAWQMPSGAYQWFAGSQMYALAAADITNGLVTLRLMSRHLGTGVTKLIYGTVDDQLHVWAKNLGPVDPH